ncbi:Vps35 domain-containing protein [Cephalotus follicularis]|uniref:Vps35 domain-containing protein n=1 Tax=Cephalotus follicularis TaxID=3775 RepID=A0A1Q3CNX2_CEPFO|nr:Vps35 domain-containing protein [Cephalotus follicularis]
MLGDMVRERIKQRAEFSEDGTQLCSLPEKFEASDICLGAKETCNNWFCKVGSIRELLPRIYLELALLPCWRFLIDRPVDSLQRLVMMARGLGDTLASAYCRLYMAHCARKLPSCGSGYLILCIKDIKVQLMRILSAEETIHRHLTNNRVLVSLMEPTIEYIMKCIFKDASQRQEGNALVDLGLGRNQMELFGSSPCVSIVLHYLLKELPTEVVSSNALEILHLIECSHDYSFDQYLNYRLLGFRLSEKSSQDIVDAVVNYVIQVLSQYDRLDEYLKVVDAYVDIVLQYQMDNHLSTILEGISTRACNREIVEDELASLQSILLKLLSHFKELEVVFALNHFLEILDVMYGSSRSIVNMHILNVATRNGIIRDPTTIQVLYEISQALHDDIDFSSVKDADNQQPTRLISHFVHKVDYGAELERHLMFLVECRRAFGSINELKETLVHTSNHLATKALKDGRRHLSFLKSCIAFSEVTIPSIPTHIRQLNLYLETAEVALLGGLISHLDGLIDSAISCLWSVDSLDGSRTLTDVDGLVSTIQKLCSLLVMVPGNPEGVTCIPENILSVIATQSWMTPRMKSRIFCTIVLLSATLSQNKLPYHAGYQEILGNDFLFFGDSSYIQDLLSLAEIVLQNLVDAIEQEPSQAARGSMALEACNCIVASFKANDNILPVCSKLIETAKLCLAADDKYLQSTIKYLDKQLGTSLIVV